MIRITVIAIIYVVLYAWMRSYKLKSHTIVGENTTTYTVTLPDILKYVYTVCFVFGILLAIVFAFLYIKNITNATVGHIIFALVFATIGLFVMFVCVRWRIDVADEEFTIHYAFKPEKSFMFQEVEKVKIGAKGELVIYVDNKKVRTIDALATNRKLIEEKFEKEGKISD